MALPFNTFKELTIAGLEDELVGGHLHKAFVWILRNLRGTVKIF